jgi:hypothetical protein
MVDQRAAFPEPPHHDPAVSQLEDERVRGVVGIAVRALADDLPRRALAAVFDDQRAAEIVVRECLTMDGGITDAVGFLGLARGERA